MNSLAPPPPAYVVRSTVRKALQPRFFADWPQEPAEAERYVPTPQERRMWTTPRLTRSYRHPEAWSRGYSPLQTRDL